MAPLRTLRLFFVLFAGIAAEIAKHVNFKATTLFCAPQCTCRPTKKSRSNSEYLTFATLRSGCKGRTSRSEEHTSELQSQFHLVCRLLLEKKKKKKKQKQQKKIKK